MLLKQYRDRLVFYPWLDDWRLLDGDDVLDEVRHTDVDLLLDVHLARGV